MTEPELSPARLREIHRLIDQQERWIDDTLERHGEAVVLCLMEAGYEPRRCACGYGCRGYEWVHGSQRETVRNGSHGPCGYTAEGLLRKHGLTLVRVAPAVLAGKPETRQ